jgi:hypothetical protein
MAGLNGIGPRPPQVGLLVDVLLGRQAIELEGHASMLAVAELAASLGALMVGWLVVLLAPNSQAVIDGGATRALRFSPGVATGIVAAAAFLFALTLMAEVKEFLYFQF